MCGISGYLANDPAQRAPLSAVRRMCDAIRHRGPDAEGTWSHGPCGLGHRRLSIIDLSPDGRQPMVNEDGTVALVVNGEFYDFEPLRDELIAKGHTFRSRSDSEVALHLYEEMGDAFVERLQGMFALALYDARRQRLVLARDRSGKKPLYYRVMPHGVAFASEVHALVTAFPECPPEVDLESVEEYLTLGYTCAPDTVYQGVYKLPAAHTLALEPGRQGTAQRYWKAARHPPLRGSEADLAQELRWRLMEAVKRRMVADVPLGAFLSGGVDSSTIVAMMATLSTRPVKTFSIGFPQEAYSEVKYARMVAERYGTEHHEMTVTANMVDCVKDIVRHHGEPFADSSAVATYYLAKLTREHVTVSLSGDAGDENFAGYKRYNTARLAHAYDALPEGAKPLVRKGLAAFGGVFFPSFGRFASTLEEGEAARYLQLVNQFSPDRRHALAGPALRGVRGGRALRRFTEVLEQSDGRFPMARVLDLDFTTYLTDDINAKVDIASMAFALEVRCPFLDTDIIEFAARLPSHLLMRTRGKHLLRKAAEDMLPWEILHRPKMGFGIPLDHWLRHDLRALLHDTLLGRAARERGVYDPGYVTRLLATLDTRAPETYAIWALFILELWFQEFIDRPMAQPEATPTLAP
jgi:asparagine synthase (glutamine-hydrolysing)